MKVFRKSGKSAAPPPDTPDTSDALEVALDFFSDVVKMESDRENNLNTRAAAVAAAAGLILALAGPVAKTIFREMDEAWTSDVAVAGFALALLGVALSMAVTVWKVLRPRKVRSIGRKALAGDLSYLWAYHEGCSTERTGGDSRQVAVWPRPGTDLATLLAEAGTVRRYALDRSLEALASWWTRNLDKQEALRRSYVVFAVAVAFFVATGGALLVDEVFFEPATNAGVDVSWWALFFAAVGIVIYAAAWGSLSWQHRKDRPDLDPIEKAFATRQERVKNEQARGRRVIDTYE